MKFSYSEQTEVPPSNADAQTAQARMKIEYLHHAARFATFQSYSAPETLLQNSCPAGSATLMDLLTRVGEHLYPGDPESRIWWQGSTEAQGLWQWIFHVASNLPKPEELVDGLKRARDLAPPQLRPELQQCRFLLLEPETQRIIREGQHEFLSFALEDHIFYLELAPAYFVPAENVTDVRFAIIPQAAVAQASRTFYMYTGGDWAAWSAEHEEAGCCSVEDYWREKQLLAPSYAESTGMRDGFCALCGNREFVLPDNVRHVRLPAGLSHDELNHALHDAGFPGESLDRMLSATVFQRLYVPAATVLQTDGAPLEERERAARILLLCREWSERWYDSERQFEEMLPARHFVNERCLRGLARPIHFGSTRAHDLAVEAASLSDEALAERVGRLCGVRMDLKHLPVSETLYELYRPLYTARTAAWRRCQTEQTADSERDWIRAASDFADLKILLQEWFYRHAWLSALPFPDRTAAVQRTFCTERWLQGEGIPEFFELSLAGLFPAPWDCQGNHEHAHSGSRHPTFFKLFKTAGVGPGGLVLDAGCGKNEDIVMLAAMMGASAVAADPRTDAIAEARASAEKTLSKPMVPSMRSRVDHALRSIQWRGGNAGDLQTLDLPSPAQVVVMEGLIDPLRIGSGSGCFGGPPPPWYSEAEMHQFLRKGRELLAPGGMMLIGVFQDSPGMIGYFKGVVERFCAQHDLVVDERELLIPRGADHSFGGPSDERLFVCRS